MKVLSPVNGTLDVTARQIHRETVSFPGTLIIGVGSARLYFSRSATVVNVIVGSSVVPVGATIIFDLNKNGITMFTTQASRPTIALGNTYDGLSVPDITTIIAGDYLTADIDQVGSTTAGADAVLIVEYYHTTA